VYFVGKFTTAVGQIKSIMRITLYWTFVLLVFYILSTAIIIHWAMAITYLYGKKRNPDSHYHTSGNGHNVFMRIKKTGVLRAAIIHRATTVYILYQTQPFETESYSIIIICKNMQQYLIYIQILHCCKVWLKHRITRGFIKAASSEREMYVGSAMFSPSAPFKSHKTYLEHSC